jgi:CubicO group peptidase (beta-lactamase class C family)
MLFLFSVPFVQAQNLQAQEFQLEGFESFVEDTLAASTIPGASVVFFDENGIVYQKAFGIADNKDRPVTLDTPFQLGSVSKSFAALLIVQLASEGALDLDDKVTQYLPYFRTKDETSWQDITVRHALSHRSGLSTLDGNRLQDETYRGEDALEIAVRTLSKATLKARPGEALEYSNANYMIVAAIVEAVSEQSFEAAMKARIFGPLGMKNSYVQMPAAETETVQEATGFRQWFGKPVARHYIAGRGMMGAGGVTASASDLATYVQAVSQNDPRIIPAEFSKDIIRPHDALPSEGWDYGFGWMLSRVNGDKYVFHSGLNGGFAAHAAYFPDQRRGGVVVTNQSGSLQADVPGVIIRKGLNIPMGSPAPTSGQKWMIWGLLLTWVSLAFFAVLSTVRFSAHVKKMGGVSWFRRAAPAILLFGLAYGLAFIAPSLNAITLSGIRVFFPDMWLCLLGSALIAVMWGIARLIYPHPKSL